MVPIVSIIGKSNVGKTTLLERLVGELKRRGYRIAVIKHLGRSVELDHPGKDSWRLAQAGADAVIASSPEKLVLIKPMEHDATLEELCHFISADFDLILTEGYIQDKAPKIEVHRKKFGGDLLSSHQQLLAVVTDEPLDISLPQYSTDDIKGLTDFIEQRFISKQDKDIARGKG